MTVKIVQMRPTLILIRSLVALLLASSPWAQAIHDAVMADSPDQLEKAIASGADINQIGPGGQTPLMHAVLGGKLSSVKYLLKVPLKFFERIQSGPVLIALTLNLISFIIHRRYLKAGADTSIGEKDGYTPLHGAGFQGRAEIARLLIDHGLDPNERHSDG